VWAAAVERVAVLGAGVMGGGIAQLLSYRDIDVRLKDINSDALGLGLGMPADVRPAGATRPAAARDVERHMDAIAPTLEYSGFATVDLVIEAVVERMDVKKQVLRETESHVRPAACSRRTRRRCR
jgi:3-hydroxyacyl-CoA dehydrogenase